MAFSFQLFPLSFINFLFIKNHLSSDYYVLHPAQKCLLLQYVSILCERKLHFILAQIKFPCLEWLKHHEVCHLSYLDLTSVS